MGSQQVLDLSPIQNLSGHTVSFAVLLQNTARDYDATVALGKSLVGEKIITIKCRTLESSTKTKENEAAKTKFSEMWWLIFFSALTTKGKHA